MEPQEPLELRTGEDVMDVLADPKLRRSLLVNVWPDAARAFLDINQRNRTVTQSRVNEHALALQQGRWQLINNGLGLDTNGDLADGQHRLLGIIRADMPGLFWMVTGLDVKAREVIDTGRARTMKDTLQIHGYGRGHNHAAAAARFLYKLDHDMVQGPHSKETSTIPHDVLMRYIEQDLDFEFLIDCVNRATVTTKSVPGMNRSAYTVFLYQVRMMDETKAAVFNERVHTGANLQRNDPELRLRNLLAKMTDRRSLTWHYALYVKTWNLRCLGRKIENLALRIDESLQKPMQPPRREHG